MPREKKDFKRFNFNISSINDLFLQQIMQDYNIDKTQACNMILNKARLIYFKDRLIL